MSTAIRLFQDLADEGDSGYGRRPAERDFDEVVFSAPFRRLAGKAQVFPMLHDDSAHNRLVHSLECASVARSLGRAVSQALRLPPRVCPGDIAATVATAALTHDIGNPPFGHAGESAIQACFSSSMTWYKDLGIDEGTLTELRSIDGNALGLHMLLRDLSLSPTTILAATKRPWTVGKGSKYCVLSTDAEDFGARAQEAGIKRQGNGWQRHPLSYLTEAADDICYLVMDAIDAVDLRVISENQCRKLLEPLARKKGMTLPRLRDAALGRLVKLAGEAFCTHRDAILLGAFGSTLVESIDKQLKGALARLRDFERKKVYSHCPVVQMEVAGFQVLQTLIEAFSRAVARDTPSPREKKLRQLMPPKFQGRLKAEKSPSKRVMEAVFYVTGMTDRYAYELCQTLEGVRLPRMLP